jgi:hydrogenase maturation protein HypF
MELSSRVSADGNLPDDLETRRYRICGVVQGVGFRPFVHRLAQRFDAAGWVLNDSNGVLLEVQGQRESLEALFAALVDEPPPLSRITSVSLVPVEEPAARYERFEIRQSIDLNLTETIVPPDSNVCKECLRELWDRQDRRYRYPFINCTHCGPRYSIICNMPYDRAQSTMRSFAMCERCSREYHDIEDRRYHSVTSTIENGFVHLPDKAEGLAEYLHEMTSFPKGKHDDWITLCAGGDRLRLVKHFLGARANLIQLRL